MKIYRISNGIQTQVEKISDIKEEGYILATTSIKVKYIYCFDGTQYIIHKEELDEK